MNHSLRQDRIKAAIGTVLLEGLLAYALLTGLMSQPETPEGDEPVVVALVPPPEPQPPPPPEIPSQPRTRAPEGAASPANLRAKATEIVAPTVPLLLPSPVIAAPDPGPGNDPSAGAADVPGPGTGSGGLGRGTGSGRGGYGPGGGGGGGRGTPPRLVSGRLRVSDYPRWAWEARIAGTVSVIVTIETEGRVVDCEVVNSSGSSGLDDLTCRLIQERFRYRPGRDDQGRPRRTREFSNHSWGFSEEPPER